MVSVGMKSAAPASAACAAQDDDWPSPVRGWILASLLSAAYVLSFVDRMIMTLLVPQIKRSLLLSDIQIGLLVGFAFAFFYAAMAIPVGWWADRGSRKAIVVFGIAFWSLMTAACGLASSWTELFWARVGVGIGEAMLAPAALSMIADSFPARKRVRPVGLFIVGGVIGVAVAFIGGSALIRLTQGIGPIIRYLPWTDEPLRLLPWQLAFFLAAAPGPVIALMLLFVREPERRGVLVGDASGRRSSFSLIAGFARRHVPTYAALYGAMALLYAFIYGFINWLPTLFLRKFGMPETQFGRWFGIAALVGGVLGTITSTTLVERLQSRGRADAHLLTILIFVAVGGPVMVAGALIPNPVAAFACFAPAMFFLTGLIAVPQAALQIIVPNQVRAQSTAVYHFVMNTVGASGGPLLVAVVSQVVLQDEGALDIALAMVGVLTLPAAVWICLRSLQDFGASVLESRQWESSAG